MFSRLHLIEKLHQKAETERLEASTLVDDHEMARDFPGQQTLKSVSAALCGL